MSHLVPCPTCRRHVRAHEPACPFCGVTLDLSAYAAPELPRARIGRAALFAFGATLAASLSTTACGDSDSDEGGGKGGTAGSGGASSGGTSSGGASSGGTSSGGTSSGGTSSGGTSGAAGNAGFAGMAAEYGAPPFDAGLGGFSADYGAPPPDSGR